MSTPPASAPRRAEPPAAVAQGPAPAPAPSRAALVLAFAAIYLIWGSTYLGIRVAVGTMPPFLMAGARFLIAGTLLFAWLKFIRGAPRPTLAQWRVNAIIRTF